MKLFHSFFILVLHVAMHASLLFEPLSATTTSTTTKAKTTTTTVTTTTVTTTTKTLPGATTTTTKTTTTTTQPPAVDTTKSSTTATTTERVELEAPSEDEIIAGPVTTTTKPPVITTTTKPPVVNTPAPIAANTETPNIGGDDSTRMPLEDAQKIFLPIVIIFTVIAIALAIGYFIKAGKTAMAKKWMIIFIGMCFV